MNTMLVPDRNQVKAAAATSVVYRVSVGSMSEYRPEENWQMWIERLDQYFSANYIEDNKRVSVLLTLIAEQGYKMLRDLCDPVLPKDIPYDQLCNILAGQYSKRVSVFKECVEFYGLGQLDNETIKQWFARVANKAVDCNFGTNLNDILKDRFVSGLRKSEILDRVCEEDHTRSFEHILEVALNREAAVKLREKMFLEERQNRLYLRHEEDRIAREEEERQQSLDRERIEKEREYREKQDMLDRIASKQRAKEEEIERRLREENEKGQPWRRGGGDKYSKRPDSWRQKEKEEPKKPELWTPKYRSYSNNQSGWRNQSVVSGKDEKQHREISQRRFDKETGDERGSSISRTLCNKRLSMEFTRLTLSQSGSCALHSDDHDNGRRNDTYGGDRSYDRDREKGVGFEHRVDLRKLLSPSGIGPLPPRSGPPN